MRAKNIPWPRVYHAIIDGFTDLPFYERIYQSRKLRRAVAAFLKRRGG